MVNISELKGYMQNQNMLTKASIISSTVSWLKHLSSVSNLDKMAE